VVVADAEFLEQHVEALALGDEHGRAQALADVELRALLEREVAQQVLRQQDARDLVAILAHHREARVPGLDHHRQDLLRRVVAAHHHHLRARHHDVAHLDLGDLQHAFEHGEHVRVDQAAVAGVLEHVAELLEVARLARQGLHEASQPAAGLRGAFFAHGLGGSIGR
jgi:hypothetical protein